MKRSTSRTTHLGGVTTRDLLVIGNLQICDIFPVYYQPKQQLGKHFLLLNALYSDSGVTAVDLVQFVEDF